MENHKRPPATVLFIFGGSGDLNFRKLSPALYNLFIDNWMPEEFSIIGIGRTPYSDADYRSRLLDGIRQFSRRKDIADAQWQSFSQHVFYLKMDAERDENYSGISDMIQKRKKNSVNIQTSFFLYGRCPTIGSGHCKKTGKGKHFAR
jgi:glucose-6-phosphate 1-dehydrogenase